jgi:membrane-associated phospholipid phosphatase
MTLAVDLTFYFPMVMALGFLAGLYTTPIPAKGCFLLRIVVAMLIALLLAHMNRMFELWPAHRYFASGHMTFALGMAIALGMLRPWTLAVTLPLLIPFGEALVALHFHSVEDVVGAVLLVPCIYLCVDRAWGLSPSAMAAKPVMQAAVVGKMREQARN